MSVYCLVGGLRRLLAGAVPRAPSVSRPWLRMCFAMSLAAYLALKLAGVFAQLPAQVDLTLLPAGVSALGLAVSARREEAAEAECEGALRPLLLAGLVLVAFTTIYLVLNTVPMTSSSDESAIVNGAHELTTKGSLEVTSPLNQRYHTNIIGSLDVTYRTPTAMYHRVFPGTALSYAPFSLLGDSGYYFYTALFGVGAVVALYLMAWKLLGSWWGAFAAALMFAATPAFGHWAATVYNNVPALSLELGALALLLWSTPPRRWQLGLAGALLALAVFLRVTEFIFVPPMLALAWWRCRSWSRCLPFALTALSCVPLVLITNAVFFHSPFFFPHVGSEYLSLEPDVAAGSRQGLLERYFLYVIGVSGSASNFHLSQKVDNLWFHVRYFGSSTFAFPFLAIAFLGLVWWLVARRRHAWLLGSATGVSLAAILLIYGHQHNNYFGYGLPIARSSFVRYALPVYGLLAIAGGAFFLEAARIAQLRREVARYAFVALVAIVGTVGIARSYDHHVYGFNRQNDSREHDRTAWQLMDSTLQERGAPVLLIAGANSTKLIDGGRYPETINYGVLPFAHWDMLLFPVVDQALAERQVYLVVSAIQLESATALLAFSEQYYLNPVVRSGNWAMYSIEPGIYEAQP